mmetsp:Transcript_170/g.354  ORF Transcript_170/g.354 Transcript_170/m.354 type:complete len:216 (+) Transcript_170:532-1179(+)
MTEEVSGSRSRSIAAAFLVSIRSPSVVGTDLHRRRGGKALLTFSSGEVDEYADRGTSPIAVAKTLSAFQSCLLVTEVTDNVLTLASTWACPPTSSSAKSIPRKPARASAPSCTESCLAIPSGSRRAEPIDIASSEIVGSLSRPGRHSWECRRGLTAARTCKNLMVSCDKARRASVEARSESMDTDCLSLEAFKSAISWFVLLLAVVAFISSSTSS